MTSIVVIGYANLAQFNHIRTPRNFTKSHKGISLVIKYFEFLCDVLRAPLR